MINLGFAGQKPIQHSVEIIQNARLLGPERQLLVQMSANFEKSCFLKGAVGVKKKNVIGHMMASREHTAGWLRRTRLIPRLICLLLAVVIWLAVVNLTDEAQTQPDNPDPIAGALTE